MNKVIRQDEILKYKDQIVDHYMSLSAGDRYCRFFNTISREGLETLLDDQAIGEHPTHYFVHVDNGKIVAIAQLGIEVIEGKTVGDIAISVQEEYRDKKIGKGLVEHAIDFSYGLDLNAVKFECALQNHSCRFLFTKLGFDPKYDYEQRCYVGELSLRNENT